jgi:hypothetical protein
MSLVTIVRYRVITSDSTSASATIEQALADAQALLEDDLGRGVESEERTERLRIHYGATFPGGRVYPAVTPITEAGDYTLVGVAALDGASPSGGPFDTSHPSYASVTYTGGWTTDDVPACIERDIAWAAYRLMRPAELAAVPAGVTSVSMGDASVSFDRPRSAGEAGISWSRATMRHKRRRV